MSWQLWLARDLVVENVLPWQSGNISLTPGRVAQSMFSLLVDIGTPTKIPKHRGKSPGWEKGKVRTKAPCLFNLLPLEFLSNSLPEIQRWLLLAVLIF
ncbi:MAG: hypothetical protein JGK13_32440 [Microcoleus sp. PH2017_37_MFU_D_B]|uniref:hypothetical protein n=1 Tax=Microcoleus sp. PH2017_37_MFU_D_B TaxID=2798847 RepID=UPI001D9C0C92|nr:hypothetical protein [Microcoleus sp. PH2017_37_MFU_D_B]MCC3638991.1 hypothetical protein [Microcoleus sp. PH2017_37_MFU_D_B]